MTAQEQRESDAIRFVNTIAKANKMLNKQYESLKNVNIFQFTDKIIRNAPFMETQLSDVRKLALLLHIPVIVRPWDGEGDYHLEYFDYKGTRFFTLYSGRIDDGE